jgi:predicted HTH transcriptional regulator
MLNKRLSELTPTDFHALIGLSESRYLDFKSAPVGGSHDDRREFLADVSAFANGAGGDIVYGITEQEGVADAAPGITLADADQEKLRLADLIRSALEPRLSNFEVEWVPRAGNVGYRHRRAVLRLPLLHRSE